MLVIRAGIHKMHVRTANGEDLIRQLFQKLSGLEDIKNFSMLNSAEQEIYPAHKC